MARLDVHRTLQMPWLWLLEVSEIHVLCPSAGSSQTMAAASVSSFGFGGTNGHVLLARPAAPKAGVDGHTGRPQVDRPRLHSKAWLKGLQDRTVVLALESVLIAKCCI